MAEKFRTVEAYKNYFADFLAGLAQPVKDKIYWTFRLIETIPRVSEKYLKKLEGTDGLFEIRIEYGGDIFRIFCFFDEGKLVILLNGFAKKTQKTPRREIKRALRLREQYYEEKS
jgi:phage-related protein